MAFAPVEEGHEHYGTRLHTFWDIPLVEAQGISDQLHLSELREERNRRLAETDWWANSDLTMTAEQTAYRQALRDITDTYTSLEDVVWPTKPEV